MGDQRAQRAGFAMTSPFKILANRANAPSAVRAGRLRPARHVWHAMRAIMPDGSMSLPLSRLDRFEARTLTRRCCVIRDFNRLRCGHVGCHESVVSSKARRRLAFDFCKTKPTVGAAFEYYWRVASGEAHRGRFLQNK